LFKAVWEGSVLQGVLSKTLFESGRHPMFSLFTVAALLAVDPNPSITVEAEIGVPSQPGYITPFSVKLVGEKDVSVITDGLTATIVREEGKATIYLTKVEMKDTKGRLIVQSASRLGVVKLQPGEVTFVNVTPGADYFQVIKDAAAGQIKLVVEYEIPEGLGRRHGVVSGKFIGIATLPKK
jgi:hypothetical protein